MPVLLLTARHDLAGAEDYVVKPVHLPELLAGLRAPTSGRSC